MYRVKAPDSARLFLAVWPSPPVLGELLQSAAQWRWTPAASRTPPGKVHLTLHFIGNVPASCIGTLEQRLRVPFEPFDWALSVAEVWPGGIAVLGSTTVPPALAQLHARLAEALHALDLPVEPRPFRPHVTLARKAQGVKPPAAMAPVRWHAADGYRLVRSAGGIYESLAGFA